MKLNNLICLSLILALSLMTAGLASASTVTLSPLQAGGQPADTTTTYNVPFPTAGDAYYSATNGGGTIPSGGQTAYMWTTGDYVMSSVFTLPTTAVTDITADWTFQNYMNGDSETWYVYVNGTAVAQLNIADCGGCGTYGTVTGTVDFGAIAPLAGGYQLELILQNTIAPGNGSAAWADGGVTGLSYSSAIPEPGSMALMGLGLLTFAGMLRRKMRQH